MNTPNRRWTAVAALSVTLLFFSVPHILEDFALGEPLKRGVPPAAIAFVVSSLLAAQALGLYWVAQRRALGLWVHGVLGLLWAVAAGMAQVPEMVSAGTYRSGFLSAAYVVGIIALGAALLLSSLVALRTREVP